jgi:hypothetical protein
VVERVVMRSRSRQERGACAVGLWEKGRRGEKRG